MFTLIILFLIFRAMLRPRWMFRPWGMYRSWGMNRPWGMYRGFGTWDRPFVGGPGPRGPGMGRW